MKGGLRAGQLIASASIGAWAAACGGGDARSPMPAAAAKGAAIAGGEVVRIESRLLDGAVHLRGELSPFQSVELMARVTGQVTTVSVDRGAHVREGDVLVTLEAPELVQQRAEAEARLANSRQASERLRAASRTAGSVAASDLDAADATFKADQARADALRQLEGFLRVRAPFAGVIAERRVHPGALVGPTQASALLRLEDHDRLRLTVAVPEELAGGVHTGTPVPFTVSAYPGEKFAGHITRSSGSVDPRSRAMAVEVDVRSSGRLAPGMYADVTWHVRRAGPSLLVPPGAIVQTATRLYVVRVRDGRADLVDVRRGSGGGDQVEVFGVLAAGDSLLKRGSEDILQRDSVAVFAPEAKRP